MYTEVSDEIRVNNRKLCEFVAKAFDEKENLRALIIDEKSELTARYLINHCNMRANNICSVNIHSTVIQKMKENGLGTIIVHGNFNEWSLFINRKLESPHVIFADFTGRFEGNFKKCYYPGKDVFEELKYNKNNHIVFALTVSCRNQERFKQNQNEESVAESNIYIIEQGILIETQWRIINRWYTTYVINGPMFFIIYELVKDATIDPTEAEYIIFNKRHVGFPRGYSS